MATAYPGGLRKRGGLLDYEDTIQATPRNPFFGGVADLLGQAYKLPEMPRLGVPGLDFVAANRNRLMDLLGIGDVQKTAEALSYGNRLGTGTGMTYQPLPETMGAAMAVAPFAGKAIRATEGLPVGASTKLIGETYPQAEAMRLAQKRAALPVEQGGLGLLESNTAMDRAKAMGAEDVYHGTNAKKQILNDLKFNLNADQRNVGGIWTTKDKNYASWLADQKDRNNANVMSLKLLNAKNSYEYDILQEGIKLADEIGVPIPKNPLEAQELLSGGYGWDRVVGDLLSESKLPNLKITNFNDAYHSNPNEVTTAFITKDPSLLRLSNAAFDPFRRTAATAAAMGVAAPDLLAAETPEELKRRQLRGLLAP
jgi:hypothetical protein